MAAASAAYKRNQSLQFVWTGVETNVTDVSTLAFALDTIYCTPSLQGSTPQELAQVRTLLLAAGRTSPMFQAVALRQSFYAEVKRKAAFLASNVMLVPFGWCVGHLSVLVWLTKLRFTSAHTRQFALPQRLCVPAPQRLESL